MRVRNLTLRSTGERKTGVIARELIAVHPEMVRMNPDGFYAVDTPNSWILVKVLQELKAKKDKVAGRGANAKDRSRQGSYADRGARSPSRSARSRATVRS